MSFEEQKLFEIDNGYMLDVIMIASMIDVIFNKSGDRATYPLKGIKYINENESRIKKNPGWGIVKKNVNNLDQSLKNTLECI